MSGIANCAAAASSVSVLAVSCRPNAGGNRDELDVDPPSIRGQTRPRLYHTALWKLQDRKVMDETVALGKRQKPAKTGRDVTACRPILSFFLPCYLALVRHARFWRPFIITVTVPVLRPPPRSRLHCEWTSRPMLASVRPRNTKQAAAEHE